jgi:hypothetical protein
MTPADGINIKLLPEATMLFEDDKIIFDRPNVSTQIINFSSIIVKKNQVEFYSEFVTVSGWAKNATTLLSGGISPSGSIVPNDVGVIYFADDTKDFFISVGTITNKDWRRILTVDY